MLYNLLPGVLQTAVAMQEGGDGGAGAIMVIIYLAIIVVMIAALWKIFSKAGQPGWAAIIPIYNVIVLLRIVGRPWWWLLLMLIPIVNIIIEIMVIHGLSTAFGRGVGFTIGIIFLPFIFLPILAFGSAEYRQPATA